MTISGIDLASGKDRLVLSIMRGDKLLMVIDRNDLNAKRASRKSDREFIARALCAIVERHGATVTCTEQRWREVALDFDLNGVGALVHIDDCFGGYRSLVHWYCRGGSKFSKRFCRMIGDLRHGRPHHKATSCPSDWYSLAMFLDAGLCLAARGEAFEPQIDL